MYVAWLEETINARRIIVEKSWKTGHFECLRVRKILYIGFENWKSWMIVAQIRKVTSGGVWC
jgi:hypothetical protein